VLVVAELDQRLLCTLVRFDAPAKRGGLIQITPGVMGLTTSMGQRLVTHPEPYVDELELALLNSS
jgi:hypothetical protein